MFFKRDPKKKLTKAYQKKMEAEVVNMPSREDVQLPINEAFIVEFCSR